MVGRIFIVLLESQCWVSDDYKEKEINKSQEPRQLLTLEKIKPWMRQVIIL